MSSINHTRRSLSKTAPFFFSLALVALLQSCNNDVELRDHTWCTTRVLDYGNQPMTLSVDLLCNTGNTGVLFIGETYASEPVPYGVYMPFNYTWDGSSGSACIIGTDVVLPLKSDHAKSNTLNVDFSALGEYIPVLRNASYALDAAGYYVADNLDGSRWQYSFDLPLALDTGDAVENYLFELSLSADSGLLQLVYSRPGADDSHNTWHVGYTYVDGVADLTVTTGSYSFKACCYMPDAGHLFFFDGESMVPFSRVEP